MDYPDRTRSRGRPTCPRLLAEARAISPWYQLTIERNTHFWSAPPALPDESALESIQQAGEAILADAGLHQYEVSAFSKEERREPAQPQLLALWRLHWIGGGRPRQDLALRRHHYSNATHPDTCRLSCRDGVIAPVTATGGRDFACGEDHRIRHEYFKAQIGHTAHPLYENDGRDCRAADRGGRDSGIPGLAGGTRHRSLCDHADGVSVFRQRHRNLSVACPEKGDRPRRHQKTPKQPLMHACGK